MEQFLENYLKRSQIIQNLNSNSFDEFVTGRYVRFNYNEYKAAEKNSKYIVKNIVSH